MISFNLRCEGGHEFESWFRDSAAFEQQREQGLLECPYCGGAKVSKALSTPNITTGRNRDKAAGEKMATMQMMIANMRQEVEKNCENVGDRFAEEARKIHNGDSEKRGIYGQATRQETKELAEDGIPFSPLPWIDEKQKN